MVQTNIILWGKRDNLFLYSSPNQSSFEGHDRVWNDWNDCLEIFVRLPGAAGEAGMACIGDLKEAQIWRALRLSGSRF